MGKIIQGKIDQFDGGIANDPRSRAPNVARAITNFDALTFPHKLVPYRSSEDGDSDAATSQKQNFTVAVRSGVAQYKLFALGVISGTGRAQILMKELSTGATTTDLDDSGWGTPANNESASGATSFDLFTYYKKTGLIYGAKSGTDIWSFDPTSVAPFDESDANIGYTDITEGLVHSKDDILYIGVDYTIVKNNNGSWTNPALTMPSFYKVNSICEYGNYLAIALAPLSGVGNSRVYLWDRNTTLATIDESIDWGSGELMILEELNGYLVGITLRQGLGGTEPHRIVIKYLSGNRPERLMELKTGNSSASLPKRKQKVDDRLYFLMSASLHDATREGLWSLGRTPGGPFALVHERTSNNDTALGSGVLKGFFIVQDFTFISSTTNAAVYQLSKTDDQATYTATSIYESKIIDDGDSSVTKKLLGVTVHTEYMPADGQVVLAYKKDNETSFTTIFTNATDGDISHSAINIESTGGALPEYKEITFRIESTGGAEITGLSWKSEVIEKKLY